MLEYIKISNVAVIASAQVQFHRGLNVLSGETGAGKSLIIDSINLILGQRSSHDLIRHGEGKAVIEALFTVEDDETAVRLAEEGLLPEDDRALAISRELYADGKNICRINGRLATVGQLRELGRSLLTIHGQQDNQALLQRENHLQFLDKFAQEDDLLSAYQAAFSAYQAAQKELLQLQESQSERERRLDFLAFQVEELDKAALLEGEDEALEKELAVLENAEDLAKAAQKAHHLLSENEPNAVELLEEAAQTLLRAARHDEALEPIAGALEECAYQVRELSSDAERYGDAVEVQPDRLDEVQERLDLIAKLKKKYGHTVADILAYFEQCQAELEAVEHLDDTMQQLEQTAKAALAEAERLAATLSEKRQAAAVQLEKGVLQALADLDMGKVAFAVAFQEKELDKTGADQVEFFIATDPAAGLRPLSKIASGGEMSRIMLALKSVLADVDPIDTLIFDEIDTGVSGRAAQKMSKKLRALGRRYQVICITHLPQLAAMADYHYLIQKEDFSTRVHCLSDEERMAEVARIIGGERVTEVTLQSARDLIEQNRRMEG